MTSPHRQTHLRCASCRSPIAPTEPRFRCSVSACNAGRLKLRFCTVACFERHVPTARHRRAECIREAAELAATQSQAS